jgi:hypothetical protein
VTRILFIGNSFTQRNDLPGMLAALAASAKPAVRIETGRVIANGMALKTHWTRGEARELIRRKKWDFVVLQEQSTRPLKNPKLMHEYVRLFNDDVVAAGARTALYMTWARRESFDRQDELGDAYTSIGRELGAVVVPVGTAWKLALADDPALVLHDKDGSHPSPAGTYLAACVFYAALFGASPVGLATDVPGLDGTDEALLRRLQEVARRAAISRPATARK